MKSVYEIKSGYGGVLEGIASAKDQLWRYIDELNEFEESDNEILSGTAGWAPGVGYTGGMITTSAGIRITVVREAPGILVYYPDPTQMAIMSVTAAAAVEGIKMLPRIAAVANAARPTVQWAMSALLARAGVL